MKLKNIVIGILSMSIIFTASVPFTAYGKGNLPDIGDIDIDFDIDTINEASYSIYTQERRNLRNQQIYI